MKILSIDPGIKNLAFCLFEKSDDSEQYKITKWDTINISEEEILKCGFIEKNIICNKIAKFKKDDICFCLKHSKKQKYQIPTPDLKSNFIKKQKLEKLIEIGNKYKLSFEKKIKKIDLLSLINSFIDKNYLQEIHTVNASEVNLFNIGKNIKYSFDKLFNNEEVIDYVIIENQISPIATRMKTIQGMIVQYFIMSNINVTNIEFIAASNKLKGYDSKDKTKYSDRKKLGISKCLEIISNEDRFKDQLNYFNLHKKKDDLSDSFLQGIWFITNNKF